MSSGSKKIFPWILGVAVLAGIIVALRARHPARPQREETEPTKTAIRSVTTNQAATPSRPAVAPSASPVSASAQAAPSSSPSQQRAETPFVLGSADASPTMDPETVVGNMRIAINNYASMFKENPVGTNPEITEELNGGNPKSARFIKEDSGLRINGRGELVDSWGTPFFFHQISGTEMEIRSAGPDKRMWTADDVVTK